MDMLYHNISLLIPFASCPRETMRQTSMIPAVALVARAAVAHSVTRAALRGAMPAVVLAESAVVLAESAVALLARAAVAPVA